MLYGIIIQPAKTFLPAVFENNPHGSSSTESRMYVNLIKYTTVNIRNNITNIQMTDIFITLNNLPFQLKAGKIAADHNALLLLQAGLFSILQDH